MKLFKILLFFLLALALCVGGALFYSGSIIKKSITTVGPKVLGVPVTLENIQVQPTKGIFSIDQLTIDNPSSYKSEYAFHLGKFQFHLEPMTVLRDVIHIHDIQIKEAIIICDGLQANNHQDIIKNITRPNSDRPQSDQNDNNDEEVEKEDAASTKKVIIDHFQLTDSKLIIQLDGEVITKVDFPNIELAEIGQKGAAVSGAEAAMQIYQAIMSETTQVLTINEDVIRALANAKLKKFGIKDVKDLEDPEKLLKDPEVVNKVLNSLFGS